MAPPPDLAGVRAGEPERDAVAAALERVRDALRGMTFGTVTVTVQDGVVVQIDRTEKLRLDRARGR